MGLSRYYSVSVKAGGFSRQGSQSVQFSCSVVSDSATPWTAAHQASLSITNSWSLLKLMSFKSVMPSKHLILCRPLLLLPSIIRVFSNELFASCGQSIGASGSASVLPVNIQGRFPLELTGLISQESSPTLQFKSINSSAFFMVQLSHPYMPWSMEKLSSAKLVAGAKKVGDRWSRW